MCCYFIVDSVTFIPHGHFIGGAHSFHFLISFRRINMRLILSLKQGHILQ